MGKVAVRVPCAGGPNTLLGPRAPAPVIAVSDVKAPSAATAPIAVVAVAPPLRRVQPGRIRGIPPHVAIFHYAIPDALRGTIEPGALVWVPFAREQRMGVVMALAATAPIDHARPLGRPTRRQASLGPDLLALGAWMSAYYLAPLFECYASMLPPGALAHELELYRRTAAPIVVTEHDMRSLEVLGAFAGGKALTAAEVGRATGVRYPEDVLAPLVAGGFLVQERELKGSPLRPRERRFAALKETDDGRWTAALAGLRRSLQADIIACLRRAGGAMVVDELLAAAGARPPTLARLVERGHVGVEAGTARLVAPPGRWRTVEEEQRRVLPHRRILAVLASAGMPMETRELLGAAAANDRALADLVAEGLVTVEERVVWRDPLAGQRGARGRALVLTPDQERAWAVIADALAAAGTVLPDATPVDPAAPALAESGGPDEPPVVLLHGVTGSGKTELYLRAIQATLDTGRGAIVLVPEIALAPQTVQRVAGRFGDLVGVWHSELSAGERADTWERAMRGELRVIVGSRSALFAPVNPGLLILDEEHAESYKQEAIPRYHAREAAIVRARHAGAAVILGSATPSIESVWHAERGRFRYAELPRRVAPATAAATYIPLPEVEIVDMRAELKAGNRSIFSRALAEGLEDVLVEGRQAILFLNRRGTATFVLCRACGTVVACPRCALPLTYHGPGTVLVCHHCAHTEAPPMMCRTCGSDFIRYFGIGTERVADETAALFPHARVLRWDADVTKRRGSHEALLATFASGGADILVGTQMIAKGLDLPEVTLVGVVSADTSLGLPDLRSGERTFQLLTQVAGRAGRAAHPGRVVFQTYRPEDPAIRFAAAHDFAGFVRRELAFRGEHLYPPYSRLVRLERWGAGETSTRDAAEEMALALREETRRLGLADTEIIGPAPCFFRKIRGKYRWQVIVRSPRPHALLAGYALGPGWRLDVDPVSNL